MPTLTPLLITTTTLLLLTSLLTTPATTTTPPKRCTTLSDTNPWILSNITAFYSSTTTHQSYITFHFTDPNEGLELDTACAYYTPTAAGDESAGLADGSYHACESEEVEFAYSRAGVEVQRVYEDDCQPAPYNEVRAVGMNRLNLTSERTTEGVVCRQAEVEVEITEMA
ncbi:hypothetical protein EJ03DRAFT_45234 [Teratosphaeria nubilosa]|uniref:AA1-like domain-containing protein n=1 Tax=Teratosphaeria nubilosa TaxID=161662 RepID=A0A6G1LEP3_9PEZI|nr:hypothetical protein EJ03DRAFT_45234 [Teratosphaeria nubilosa]